MNNINFEELPEDYRELYANKLYTEMIQEKKKFNSETIESLKDIFIQNEEYEKCEKINSFHDNK